MLLLLSLVLAQTNAVDVWPMRMQRVSDVLIRYDYSLAHVARSQAVAEMRAEFGDEDVDAWLKTIPAQAWVEVDVRVPLLVSAGRDRESAPLSETFSAISTKPFVQEGESAPKASLRTSYDPWQPKVLPSVDELLWNAVSLQNGVWAALELETQTARQELWTRVGQQALKGLEQASEEEMPGYLALVARVWAVNSCLGKKPLPKKITDNQMISDYIKMESNKMRADGYVYMPQGVFAWHPDLSCAWIAKRGMSVPFEDTPEGKLAVVVFLEMLHEDERIFELWNDLRHRRDMFLGVPEKEPLEVWRARITNFAEVREQLPTFLAALPEADRQPPVLLLETESPFERFVSHLPELERDQSYDELAVAVQTGNVELHTDANSAWMKWKDAQYEPLVRSEAPTSVQFDPEWRSRLLSLFVTMQGGAREARRESNGVAFPPLKVKKPTLRLCVPPVLDVEPVAPLFWRVAESMHAFRKLLAKEKLQQLKPLTPEGKRLPQTAIALLDQLVPVYQGLAELSDPQLSDATSARAKYARSWLKTRTAQSFLRWDVRHSTAAPGIRDGQRQHAVVVGVERREVVAEFAKPPSMHTSIKQQEGLVLQPAHQRYLLPVLVTTSAMAPKNKYPVLAPRLREVFGKGKLTLEEATEIFANTIKQ